MVFLVTTTKKNDICDYLSLPQSAALCVIQAIAVTLSVNTGGMASAFFFYRGQSELKMESSCFHPLVSPFKLFF